MAFIGILCGAVCFQHSLWTTFRWKQTVCRLITLRLAGYSSLDIFVLKVLINAGHLSLSELSSVVINVTCTRAYPDKNVYYWLFRKLIESPLLLSTADWFPHWTKRLSSVSVCLGEKNTFAFGLRHRRVSAAFCLSASTICCSGACDSSFNFHARV